jgi:hypothetical protein
MTTAVDIGTIANVPMVTIVDTATGTESDGTRWTTEAPFVEAREELPIGGSDPLLFLYARATAPACSLLRSTPMHGRW